MDLYDMNDIDANKEKTMRISWMILKKKKKKLYDNLMICT